MNLPYESEIACAISPGSTFFEREEEKINKTNKKIVVVELIRQFQSLTKETISEPKMRSLVTRYGVSKVQEGLHIIKELPKWEKGAEGALCACLRDGWSIPKKAENPKTINNSDNKQPKITKDRYEAFYSLFPDN